MDVTVSMHAHRKLRHMERYMPFSVGSQEDCHLTDQVPLRHGTHIGTYQNKNSSDIIFTSDGILKGRKNAWDFTAYSQISHVIREKEKCFEVDKVILQLLSGIQMEIEIDGKNKNTRSHDKYSVMMFLDSAIMISRKKKRSDLVT